MYRLPFGDSFLLTVNTATEPHHILVDCGILQGVPHGLKWSRDVARDIQQTTRGHLDAIVVTHLHWDHVSGFNDAKEVFSQFSVDDVWLPWTENPADAQAVNYRRVRACQLAAVRQARSLLEASRDAQSAIARARLDRAQAFYGPSPEKTDALDAARRMLLGLGKTPRFLEAGMDIAPAQIPDVRVYVLGPARGDSLLGLDGYAGDRGFYGALLTRASDAPEARAEMESTMPFDLRQGWRAEWGRPNPLVRHMLDRYEDVEQEWRRIDDDWLLYAVEISERLHKTVNNLSLAFALECVSSGDVLLFPGDAPFAGWRGAEWKPSDGGATVVTAQDLLARTVFYKASDHGSLDANEVAGVEAMTRPDLVAAISADAASARGLGFDLPAPAVQARLTEKTQGRLLLPGSDERPPVAARSSSDRSFLERTAVTPLYADFSIP
jgi:hypothetical protein